MTPRLLLPALCAVFGSAALLVGCANNPEDEMGAMVDSTGGSATGNTGMMPSNTGAGTGGASDGSSGGGDTGGSEPGPGGTVDPQDPPKPAEACSEDLDVENGTVLPDFGKLPAASAFSGKDTIEDGPFKVVEIKARVKNPDTSLGELPVTIYVPSEDGTKIKDGDHPLVMLMPGYGRGFGITLAGTHPTYAFYSKHFASHGFVVAGMNFASGGLGFNGLGTPQLGAHFLTAQDKNVDEVEAVLDFVLNESEAKDVIDASKIAIAGHSQGGKVAYWVAAEDPRIDLVIGWDPQNAGGGSPCGVPGGDMCDRFPIAPNCKANESGRLHEMKAETLVFATRDKGAMPDTHQWAENFYRGAPSQTHMLLFPTGKHEDFSANDNDVAKLTMRVQMALLMSRFQGVTGLDDFLPTSDKLTTYVKDVETHNK